MPLPKTGSKAPSFKLPASNGQTISLADFAGRTTVVLYFSPQGRHTRVHEGGLRVPGWSLADYDRANVAVLGISPDPVEAVTKFAGKFHLNFPLLADADHAVTDKYGVWQEKSMYGRKYWGAARTTFIIDKAGRIAHVFEKVKPDGSPLEKHAATRRSMLETGEDSQWE